MTISGAGPGWPRRAGSRLPVNGPRSVPGPPSRVKSCAPPPAATPAAGIAAAIARRGASAVAALAHGGRGPSSLPLPLSVAAGRAACVVGSGALAAGPGPGPCAGRSVVPGRRGVCGRRPMHGPTGSLARGGQGDDHTRHVVRGRAQQLLACGARRAVPRERTIAARRVGPPAHPWRALPPECAPPLR